MTNKPSDEGTPVIPQPAPERREYQPERQPERSPANPIRQPSPGHVETDPVQIR